MFNASSFYEIMLQIIFIHLNKFHSNVAGNVHTLYTVGHKKLAIILLSIFSPIIDQFLKFFTDTFCGQFAMMRLLYISLHRKCVFTLLCEI